MNGNVCLSKSVTQVSEFQMFVQYILYLCNIYIYAK